uniref:Uncharacterized protein n=1 Tax=Hucho hucho TaxID=62062 RepID=A0A4W5QMQ1_9TELE
MFEGKDRLKFYYNFWIDLTLAVLSAFLIGGSVMLKKKVLLRLTRAGECLLRKQCGHGYLKDWLWWGGLLTRSYSGDMIIDAWLPFDK